MRMRGMENIFAKLFSFPRTPILSKNSKNGLRVLSTVFYSRRAVFLFQISVFLICGILDTATATRAVMTISGIINRPL